MLCLQGNLKTASPKEKGRKNQAKNQNHKNQTGQQYTPKYYGLRKIIMSYGKNESNKTETIKKEKKIACAHGGGHGKRKRGNQKRGHIGLKIERQGLCDLIPE